jgi:ATP-dependent DNA ligase
LALPSILHSARRLPATRFLIDGEAVVCGEDGVSDFERALSSRFAWPVLISAIGGKPEISFSILHVCHFMPNSC